MALARRFYVEVKTRTQVLEPENLPVDENSVYHWRCYWSIAQI
ncbi:hypothetical protein [Scytonema hofmannii]|nr:hypothetical protein [Scytonema hofmannii]